MRVCLFGIALAIFGCGGTEIPATETPGASPDVESAQVGTAPPPAESMQVEGLMGTLSPDEVRRGMDRRMERFSRCFTRRYRDLDLLSGDIEFAYRVGVDGNVRYVHLSQSTLGDRETERCLLRVAEGASFPAPRGGEAEFSFPLSMDLPEDVRPPVEWSPSRIAPAVAERGSELLSSCRPSGSRAAYRVTMYIARPGRVLAAGVTSDDATLEETYDCVVEQVSSWEVPTPGSYPARVSFEVR